MSTRPAEWRAPPTWALDEILVPALQQGIAAGEITVPRGLEPAQFVRQLRRCFAAGLKLRHEAKPVSFEALERELGINQPQLKGWFGKIDSWNWLVDDLRFRPSVRGKLEVAGSTMILKGDPFPRKGSSIFATASRSIPGRVYKGLAEAGLAPAHNQSSHSTSTDCSVWLVEVADGFTIVLRVLPLPEDTWFDPEKYERDLGPEARAIAEDLLERTHGHYEVSTRKTVGVDAIESVLRSISRHRESAAGVVFESGCLPQGIGGRREKFVGSRLDQALAIEQHGARSFLDLARLPVDDPKSRRRPDRKPWSGRLSIGEDDCLFEQEGGVQTRQSWEMSWGAGVALGITPSDSAVEGIFRRANERAVREGSSDPGQANYAVAQVRVGKEGTPTSKWPSVGLLVGASGGAVPSGFSVPFADVRQISTQREVIKMAEEHVERVGRDGPFVAALERLRDAGVQGTQARIREHIESLNGLILSLDILDVRSRLYI